MIDKNKLLKCIKEEYDLNYGEILINPVAFYNMVEDQSNECNGWIKCSDRMPTREEFLKNDGRFIVTDGQRVYQALFDIYERKAFCNPGAKMGDLFIDNRPIAWQPLPEPYEERDTQ